MPALAALAIHERFTILFLDILLEHLTTLRRCRTGGLFAVYCSRALPPDMYAKAGGLRRNGYGSANIVLVGASAGGIPTLQQLPASSGGHQHWSILHLPVYAETGLHSILDGAGLFETKLAEDGESLCHGMI